MPSSALSPESAQIADSSHVTIDRESSPSLDHNNNALLSLQRNYQQQYMLQQQQSAGGRERTESDVANDGMPTNRGDCSPSIYLTDPNGNLVRAVSSPPPGRSNNSFDSEPAQFIHCPK
jgi:hypothetical protein